MTKIFIIILCIGAFFTIISILSQRQRLQIYWNRVCTGTQWRLRFPQASKAEIRQFLDVFLNAFAFRKSRRFCFAPDDKIMDVYRVVYPPKWSVADSMELEAFGMDMERTYGIDIVALWHKDITLGELFATTQSKNIESCV